MSSVCKVAVVVLMTALANAQEKPELRVCADPNNLPYSNAREEGFENRLAQLVARELDMKVTYVWEAQRKSFFRKTLNAGRCDVVMEVPAGISEADATQPYYRSTYVLVTRRDRRVHVRSLDDPALRGMRIGVHVIEDEGDPPPARALIRRGLVPNLVGFSIYGNLGDPDPPADLLRAVADGAVDVAAAWGPLAGYFAPRLSAPLEVQPICSDVPDRFVPLIFAISMGVRHGDSALRDRLNAVITRRRAEIEQLLVSYGVPLVPSEVPPRCKGGA